VAYRHTPRISHVTSDIIQENNCSSLFFIWRGQGFDLRAARMINRKKRGEKNMSKRKKFRKFLA
jgi:hypothetical protein